MLLMDQIFVLLCIFYIKCINTDQEQLFILTSIIIIDSSILLII